MKNKKIILFTNIITPYNIPLFNYINKKGNFNFKIVALAEKEKNRKWQLNKGKIEFDYKILSGFNLFFYGEKREISIHINIGVFMFLLSHNPNIIIITGYDCLAYWQIFLYCKVFRKKCILWNGTTLLSAGTLKGIRGTLKKIIIKGVDSYIAYGSKAKEYLEYFGADSKKIYISTNTVDVDFFYNKVLQYRNSENFLEERKQFPNVVLIYIGQLVKRKGVEQIIKALNNLKDDDIGFIIVGSGPEEENLKKFCIENSLQNIFFEGFRQQDELPKYYALADVFILPSFEEVWGLVVNEALASGLYVLCSKYAGAAYDVINNKNGMIFAPENIEEITNLIKNTKNQIELIKSRRGEISNWARNYLSIEKSGEAVISAVESLIKEI
jgi:glycosyltransferase involved in cell wall biosynthesis